MSQKSINKNLNKILCYSDNIRLLTWKDVVKIIAMQAY